MVETRSRTGAAKPVAKAQEVHKKTEIDNKKAKKSEKNLAKPAKAPKSKDKKVSKDQAPPKKENKPEKSQPAASSNSKSEKKKDKTQSIAKDSKKTPKPAPKTTNKRPIQTPAPEPNPKVPSKPGKYLMYDNDQYKKFLELKDDLDNNALPKLKEMCRKNLMKVSGNKSDVIERIADAKILGVIPKCPACGGGRPKLDPKTMTYYCSGYLEDVIFINCHKSFKYSDIVRSPWQD